MSMARYLHNSEGFTLIELLTVIAMVSLLSIWLVRAGTNTYYDYQVRAAIEQAQQDLQLLELIRRGGGVSDVSDDDLDGLKFDIQDSDSEFLEKFSDVMSPVVIDLSVQVGSARYSIQSQRSAVSVSFPEQFVVNIDISGSSKTTDSGITTIELYSRDSDPLINSYVADAYHMKRQLGR